MAYLDVNDPLAELFSLACDGELNERQGVRLAELLEGNGPAQAAYLHYCRLHADLGWREQSLRVVELSRAIVAGRPTGEIKIRVDLDDDADQVELPKWLEWADQAWQWLIHPTTLAMIISGLFITTILLSLALWTVPRSRPALQPQAPIMVAKITASREATWRQAGDINFRNLELFAGDRLPLVDGLAEVTFADGAVVLLEGPTEFVVNASGAGTLERGKLFANVPRQAVGFLIATPTAEIVDLGTEFGVEVDSSGGTFAEVVRGVIDVQRIVDDELVASLRLRAGQAATVSSDGQGVARTPAQGRFVQALNTAETAPDDADSPRPSDQSIPLDRDTPALIDVVLDDGSMLGSDAPTPANAGVFGDTGYVNPPLAVGSVTSKSISGPKPLTPTPQTARYRCIDAESGADFSFDVRIECFTSVNGEVTGNVDLGRGNGVAVASTIQGQDSHAIDSDATTANLNEYEFVRLTIANVVTHDQGSLPRPLAAVGFTAVNITSRDQPDAAGEVRVAGANEVLGRWSGDGYRELIQLPTPRMSVDVAPTGAVATVHGFRVGFDLAPND